MTHNDILIQPKSVTAKIGPNALIQTARALRDYTDETTYHAVLKRCNLLELLHTEPAHMVDERLFANLVRALATLTGADDARVILHRSGQLTANYLLQHRIPQPFQSLLAVLPRQLALHALLFAISKHAWTFTGSGAFAYHVGHTTTLTVDCTIEPTEVTCAFYGGTFTKLLQTLIDHRLMINSSTAPHGERTRCTYTAKIG